MIRNAVVTLAFLGTALAANGSLTRESWKANPRAPIDCFYVYPTVSRSSIRSSPTCGRCSTNPPQPREHQSERSKREDRGKQE